jgi:hypothetical protein
MSPERGRPDAADEFLTVAEVAVILTLDEQTIRIGIRASAGDCGAVFVSAVPGAAVAFRCPRGVPRSEAGVIDCRRLARSEVSLAARPSALRVDAIA